jgi:hypothetical protein
VVPAGVDERRFFALEVGDGKKQDKPYFRDIQKDLEAGGYANLLHHLLNLDIKNFEVRDVPPTPFLDDQKARTLRGSAPICTNCSPRANARREPNARRRILTRCSCRRGNWWRLPRHG